MSVQILAYFDYWGSDNSIVLILPDYYNSGGAPSFTGWHTLDEITAPWFDSSYTFFASGYYTNMTDAGFTNVIFIDNSYTISDPLKVYVSQYNYFEIYKAGGNNNLRLSVRINESDHKFSVINNNVYSFTIPYYSELFDNHTVDCLINGTRISSGNIQFTTQYRQHSVSSTIIPYLTAFWESVTYIVDSYSVTTHLAKATADPENPSTISVDAVSTFFKFYPEEWSELKYCTVSYVTPGEYLVDPPIQIWNASTGELEVRYIEGDILIEVIGVGDPYPIDPSEPTDPSTIDPDSPNYDFSSTNITTVPNPGFSITDAGFVNIFAPTGAELNQLASYMWSGSFSVDNFKKLFANPMDVILGCHVIPVVPLTEPAIMSVGNYSTGITMDRVTYQWSGLDCGDIDVPEYYSAYMSYSPYTKVQIYLPFIGTKELSADVIMGKNIAINYLVDVASGACVARIYANNALMYQFSGNCAAEMPITNGDYKNIVSSIQSAVISSAGLIAGIVTGHPTMAIAGGVSLAANIGSSIDNMQKPTVSHSGHISGTAGYLGYNKPYLIISTPRVCLPSEQNTFEGLPTFETITLSDIAGFTKVDYIHPEGVNCTDDEMAELLELLKEGVII